MQAMSVETRIGKRLAAIREHSPICSRRSIRRCRWEIYRLDAWRRSGRDVSMRDRHVTETEMTRALQRALLHATDEVVGDKRAISADVYCDCLVGLFLAASPQPETPEEIEQFVALFRDKLTAALARRGVVGHS